MSIDDINGKVSGFWARAKSALTGGPPASQPPPASAPPARDSARLAHKGQYFGGYAMPPSEEAGEPKVWAPLVITPEDPNA